MIKQENYYVINNNDNGIGSLRYGINNPLYNNIIFDDNYNYENINLLSTININHSVLINNNTCYKIYIKGLNDSIFTITNKNVNFAIKGNGNISLIDTISLNEGGAIKNIFNDSTIELNNVSIIRCSGNYGGGIFTFGPLILNKCFINKNTALYVGGGIFSCNSITINDCNISYNIIETETEYIGGAGLFVYADTNSSNLTFNIEKTIISHNFVKFNPIYNTGASGAGIMILIYDYTIYFTKCIVENNLSKNGSGIMTINGNISCKDCIIQNNVSTNYGEAQDIRIKPVLTGGGCGITSMAGTINVINTIITNNKSYGMYSSGIVGFSGDVSCTNSDISNNLNAGPGAGIAVNLNCNLNVINSKISNNKGSGIGGGIINFSNNEFTTNIVNSTIQYNSLDNRENVKSAYLNIVSTFESYINYFINFIINITSHLNKISNIIQNIYNVILLLEELLSTYVKRNTINNSILNIYTNFIGGGAIGIFDNCNLSIKNSKLINNNLVEDIKELYGVKNYIASGGAIFSLLSAEINILNSLIQYNQCNGISGAIFNNGPILNIKDCQILNNLLIPVSQSSSANQSLIQNGGALYISPDINGNTTSNGSTTNILNCNINNNIGLQYGGGIYNGGGDIYINDSNIFSNILLNNKSNGGGIYMSNELSFPEIPELKTLNALILDNTPNDIYYNYIYIENIPNPKYPYPDSYSSIYDASGDIQWIFVGPLIIMQQLLDSKDPFVQLMTTPTLIDNHPFQLIGTIPSNFVLNINGSKESVYYTNKTQIPNVDLWFFVKREKFYLGNTIYDVIVQNFYPTELNNVYSIYDEDPNGAMYVYIGELKDILEVYYTDILVKMIFIKPIIEKGYYQTGPIKRLFYQNNDPVYTTVQIWFKAPINYINYVL